MQIELSKEEIKTLTHNLDRLAQLYYNMWADSVLNEEKQEDVTSRENYRRTDALLKKLERAKENENGDSN